jgi:hypothetical protein
MLVRMNGDTRVLADGNTAPVLALGVWQVPDGPECVNAVRWALEAGYLTYGITNPHFAVGSEQHPCRNLVPRSGRPVSAT